MEQGETPSGHQWGETKFGSAVSLVSVLVFAVALAGMCSLFLAVLYDGYKAGTWLPLFQHQFAAIVGVPFCIVTAVCIVLFFRGFHGPIEFQIGSLKFSGATGPVVLWIFCFAAVVIAVKFHWA